MDRLEEALRDALRRKQAPEGFAERVLARQAAAGRWERFRFWSGIPSWRWAGAVALTLVLLAGIQYRGEQRRRAEGEAAKEQVMTALRITAGKLEYTSEKIRSLAVIESLAPAAAGGQAKPVNFI